jgi:hypothetical protein
LNANLIKKLHKGDRLTVVLAPMLTGCDEDTLLKVLKNDVLYKKNPITQLLYIKLSKDLVKICSTNLKLLKTNQNGLWKIYIFQKR